MKRMTLATLILCLLCSFAFARTAEEPGFLRIENGMLQPVLKWTELRDEDYSNEGSDILRFCVWVETDYDTDLDGKADLVRALVQVPRAAAEGRYKAAVIYNPTPYGAGTVERYLASIEDLYTKEYFDQSRFYEPCEKREPAGSMTTLEAAAQADPMTWNYRTPDAGNGTYGIGFSYAMYNMYYIIRGFALVDACGIGTYGSEGFELCGLKLERDSHKAVVEWLTGDRRAFTDATSNIEIKADWCNGSVAMTGCSYGGTIPFEVAVTGVKGLKTIIPFAGIASWYDYTNSQGVSILNQSNYADYLASSNAGGTFLDGDWDKPNPVYGSWLWTIATEQEKTNGDYAPVWEQMDYTTDEENHIACSALVVNGMNDMNVTTRHADMMVEAFQKAGKTVKLVLHQGGHMTLNGFSINGTAWDEIMNIWLSHYLYGVENGAEFLPEVMAQNNITGVYEGYDIWPGKQQLTLKPEGAEGRSVITSRGMGDYSDSFQEDRQNNLIPDDEEEFYTKIPDELACRYRFDLPAGTTIQGSAELRVMLDSDRADLDGLMISAILMDVSDQGAFPVYAPSEEYGGAVATRELNLQYKFDQDPSDGFMNLMDFDQTKKARRLISLAWTDLQNPGCGKNSSEYVYQDPGLISGTEQAYTFYFLPMVYTVAEGHHLELILTTWDPYRVQLDAWFNLDGSLETQLDEDTYSYNMTINNGSLELILPTGTGDPDWLQPEALFQGRDQ
ncbi:MAG: hypothetical protein IKI84_05920 [Clostridia bacterium]|nr:hypothetical protein [Clostridia bacterium]